MRLLDLFCGAGGCSVGYHRAGFDEIVGVDLHPQPRYPFRFVQADALEYLKEYGHWFDAIHASPPCQAYTVARHINGNVHPELVDPVRVLLKASGKPWVMENVPGAPMPSAKTCCGLALGCRVKRHRLFESSMDLEFPPCPKGHPGEWYTVFGNGGGNGRPREGTGAIGRWAMGIDWMNRYELSQAIPPAYTEFVGKQLIAHLKAVQDA